MFDFYREVSALLFSLCFLAGKKCLKLEVCTETQKQHLLGGAKLSFALFASPSCSLDCHAPDFFFPGSGFFLDHGIASVSVSALTLQQTSSLSKWNPVCCSPVPPGCARGCYFRTLIVKNFWEYLVIGNKIVINAT